MGTVNYDFTYLQPTNNIDVVADTTTFLNEIDSTINSIYTEINSTIHGLHHRNIVWIGDSYSASQHSTYNGWVESVGSNLKADIHNYAKDGAGFIANHTYKMQLQDAVADASFDNASVTDVVLYGGNNDIDAFIANPSSFGTPIRETFYYAKDNLPNAKITVAVPNVNTSSAGNCAFFCDTVKSALLTTASDFNFIPYVDCWQNAYGSVAYVSDTDMHPSDTMQRVLATFFTIALNGGTPIAYSPISITPNSTYFSTSSVDPNPTTHGDFFGGCTIVGTSKATSGSGSVVFTFDKTVFNHDIYIPMIAQGTVKGVVQMSHSSGKAQYWGTSLGADENVYLNIPACSLR